jgi:PhnB protein
VADPLDALGHGDVPVTPDRTFAAALRDRLEAALVAPTPTTSALAGATATQEAAVPATTTIPVTTATATPYLCVHDADAALAFYAAAFGAVETMRIPQPAPDSRLGHAEVVVGGARIMLSDEFPELGVLSPRTLGGSPFQLHLTIDDVDIDAVIAQAEAAGATVVRPPADQFYGERSGQLVDPFGHRWTLGTPIEDVSDDEIVRRAGSDAPSVDEEVRQIDLGTRATAAPVDGAGDLGYFTLGVPDVARGKAFYGALLGWRFEPDSVQADVVYSHVGNVRPPGGLVSGDDRLVGYFRVADIHAAVAKVRELGGRAEEPSRSPSGWSAACRDDQDQPLHLWQPAEGY